MLYKDDEFMNDGDNHSNQKPNAYRVDDDNIEEKDLKRSFTDNETKPVMEGQPMGGHNFGANNVTPSGDDKNNPSQNAGYSNAYFKRTEPSEEHPENSNFKTEAQQGESDYDKAMPRSSAEENGGGDKTENGQQDYQEGTADNDGTDNSKPNVPGPNEVPDQQKVGEDTDDGKYHVET